MIKEREDKLSYINNDKRTVWWIADIDRTKLKEASKRITYSFSKTLNFPPLMKADLPKKFMQYLEFDSTVYVCRTDSAPSPKNSIILYWSNPRIHETLTLPASDTIQFSASLSDDSAKEFLKLIEKLEDEKNKVVDRSWRTMIRKAIVRAG
tara:strand:- start:281 stop:733 length:453 start_codon:yes stop_codon:yes gene_type:complete